MGGDEVIIAQKGVGANREGEKFADGLPFC